ncbi:MAG TPA: DNA recombination protein RmuC [Acidimicrobiia bacterium]|nr:DNA recombination protein RmuC [Acidimicrobiia bacterium]
MIAGLGIGLVIGALAGLIGGSMLQARARDHSLAREMRKLSEEQRRVSDEGREAAMQAAVHQFRELHEILLEGDRARASAELDGRKALIDQELLATRDGIASRIDKVDALVRELEADRQRKFGALSSELARQREGVDQLRTSTQDLREALVSTKVRGQWGERMAEDVLRLAGFIEGVNYRRQRTLAESGGRPDFTFLMPNDLVLHMDVKFPLDNYVRYIESASEVEQRAARDAFLRDVRQRVKELTGRGYLDAADQTVDCLLLFIPNEQVYAFIQEQDSGILENALRNKIVLCSPLTLYAVLAVIRQSVDNFRLERTTNEILGLLSQFEQQWRRYTDSMESVQRKFESVHKEYELLMGRRHRALERPLDRIAALRESQELTLVDDDPLALEA